MPKKVEVDRYVVANYRWLRLAEAADYCRCSIQQFYDTIYNQLPKSQMQKSSLIRYDKRDLDLILERAKVDPNKTYPALNPTP